MCTQSEQTLPSVGKNNQPTRRISQQEFFPAEVWSKQSASKKKSSVVCAFPV